MATKWMVALAASAALVVAAAGAPAIDHRNAQVLRYDIDTNDMPNSYRFAYDTSDGSSRSEHGYINEPGTPQEALRVRGATRWITDTGALYEMTYKAGKRGYRAVIKKIS